MQPGLERGEALGGGLCQDMGSRAGKSQARSWAGRGQHDAGYGMSMGTLAVSIKSLLQSGLPTPKGGEGFPTDSKNTSVKKFFSQ